MPSSSRPRSAGVSEPGDKNGPLSAAAALAARLGRDRAAAPAGGGGGAPRVATPAGAGGVAGLATTSRSGIPRCAIARRSAPSLATSIPLSAYVLGRHRTERRTSPGARPWLEASAHLERW